MTAHCPTCKKQPNHFVGHKDSGEVRFVMCIDCRPLFGPCTVAGIGASLGEAIESWNKTVGGEHAGA